MKRKCLPNADNAASKTLMQAHLKPQVLPKVFTSTARSNPAQPQSPVTSASSVSAQNSLKTRSDRLRQVFAKKVISQASVTPNTPQAKNFTQEDRQQDRQQVRR
jgi:hypothetical protein